MNYPRLALAAVEGESPVPRLAFGLGQRPAPADLHARGRRPFPQHGVEARTVEPPAASPQPEEEVVLFRLRRAPGRPVFVLLHLGNQYRIDGRRRGRARSDLCGFWSLQGRGREECPGMVLAYQIRS